jgi:Na+-translocating ferredoxin:NAD+ oxidoreductase RnfG subunit
MRDSPFLPAVVMVAAAWPAVFFTPNAFATDYMSVAEAQKLMFPDATVFAPQTLKLTVEQIKRIEATSGTSLNTTFWKVVAAKSGDLLLGYVVNDAVIGKFQLINYAVAFSPDGHIRDVEILSYRETHGGEVRSKPWRNQFVVKRAAAALAVDNDIANISGATMSCTHLTDGIRRITHYVQTVLAAP